MSFPLLEPIIRNINFLYLSFIGLLFKIAQHPEPNWDAFVAFANLIGAFSCTSYGAIKSLPTMRQFLEFVS